MLTVQHTELPTKALREACCRYKGCGNTLSVYVTISQNILQFPEGRKTLTKELALRYIGEQLNMKFQNVWKALKKLVRDGFIKILKIGNREEGTGSIIQLVMEPITNPVINSITPPLIDSITKQTTVFKETNNMSVVSSQNNNTEDSISTPKKPAKESNTPLIEERKIEEAENLPAAPAGVHKHTVRNCVKILSKRGISDLASAITAITQEMKNRTIQNINGYFTTLCKSFDFNPSSVSPAPSDQGAAPSAFASGRPLFESGSNTASVAKKAQEEYDRKTRKLEGELRQEKPLPEVWKEMQEKYPEITRQIKQKVDSSPVGRRIGVDLFRIPLYLEELKKIQRLE